MTSFVLLIDRSVKGIKYSQGENIVQRYVIKSSNIGVR